MGVIALATFSVADAIFVGNYTADSGFGQMKFGIGGDIAQSFPPIIISGKARNAALNGTPEHCVGENLVANDNFSIEATVTKANTISPTVVGSGVLFRSNHITDDDVGRDFVTMGYKGGDALTEIRLDKWINNISVVNAIFSSLAWPRNATKKIKVEVIGSIVSMYWQPSGTYVLLGTLDLSLSSGGDLNNAAHGRAGIALWNAGNIEQIDDLTLTINEAPTAPAGFNTPVSLAGCEQGDTFFTDMLVSWRAASDLDGDPLQYEGQFSSDGGATWNTLFALQSALTFFWDISALAEGNQYKVRVRAKDTPAIFAGIFGPYLESSIFSIAKVCA